MLPVSGPVFHPKQRMTDVKLVLWSGLVLIGVAAAMGVSPAQEGGAPAPPLPESRSRVGPAREGGAVRPGPTGGSREAKVATARRWAETVSKGDKKIYDFELESALRLID